jgi:predicted DNA-binding protein YlxM (UPF0122 family)
MTTDYKYEEIDFGFTAVDEDELKSLSSVETERVTQVAEATSAEIRSLDSKLTELIDMQRDVMSELISAKQSYEEKASGVDITKEVVEDKLLRVEKMIMPLLENLLKNKEKEYIYWPNREPIIRGQMQKILEITRGSDEG